MGAVPQHPFFLRVIESLQAYNRNWRVPYITVMYSTGPLFLSVVWKEYTRWGASEAGRVRILMPEEYNKNPWSFFAIYKGSSWHTGDAQAIFWVSSWTSTTSINNLVANRRFSFFTDGSTLVAPHSLWIRSGCSHLFHRLDYRSPLSYHQYI